jgi:hypothetical protein
MSKKLSTSISDILHKGINWRKAQQDAEEALGKARERVKRLEFSVAYLKGKAEAEAQIEQH